MVTRIFVSIKLYFLHIEFWKEKIFRVIDGKFSMFTKTYMVGMNSSNWEMVKINVKVDLSEGILEGIGFVLGDKEIWNTFVTKLCFLIVHITNIMAILKGFSLGRT